MLGKFNFYRWILPRYPIEIEDTVCTVIIEGIPLHYIEGKKNPANYPSSVAAQISINTERELKLIKDHLEGKQEVI